jgi:hypothetical protein
MSQIGWLCCCPTYIVLLHAQWHPDAPISCTDRSCLLALARAVHSPLVEVSSKPKSQETTNYAEKSSAEAACPLGPENDYVLAENYINSNKNKLKPIRRVYGHARRPHRDENSKAKSLSTTPSNSVGLAWFGDRAASRV